MSTTEEDDHSNIDCSCCDKFDEENSDFHSNSSYHSTDDDDDSNCSCNDCQQYHQHENNSTSNQHKNYNTATIKQQQQNLQQLTINNQSANNNNNNNNNNSVTIYDQYSFPLTSSNYAFYSPSHFQSGSNVPSGSVSFPSVSISSSLPNLPSDIILPNSPIYSSPSIPLFSYPVYSHLQLTTNDTDNQGQNNQQQQNENSNQIIQTEHQHQQQQQYVEPQFQYTTQQHHHPPQQPQQIQSHDISLPLHHHQTNHSQSFHQGLTFHQQQQDFNNTTHHQSLTASSVETQLQQQLAIHNPVVESVSHTISVHHHAPVTVASDPATAYFSSNENLVNSSLTSAPIHSTINFDNHLHQAANQLNQFNTAHSINHIHNSVHQQQQHNQATQQPQANPQTPSEHTPHHMNKSTAPIVAHSQHSSHNQSVHHSNRQQAHYQTHHQHSTHSASLLNSTLDMNSSLPLPRAHFQYCDLRESLPFQTLYQQSVEAVNMMRRGIIVHQWSSATTSDTLNSASNQLFMKYQPRTHELFSGSLIFTQSTQHQHIQSKFNIRSLTSIIAGVAVSFPLSASVSEDCAVTLQFLLRSSRVSLLIVFPSASITIFASHAFLFLQNGNGKKMLTKLERQKWNNKNNISNQQQQLQQNKQKQKVIQHQQLQQHQQSPQKDSKVRQPISWHVVTEQNPLYVWLQNHNNQLDNNIENQLTTEQSIQATKQQKRQQASLAWEKWCNRKEETIKEIQAKKLEQLLSPVKQEEAKQRIMEEKKKIGAKAYQQWKMKLIARELEEREAAERQARKEARKSARLERQRKKCFNSWLKSASSRVSSDRHSSSRAAHRSALLAVSSTVPTVVHNTPTTTAHSPSKSGVIINTSQQITENDHAIPLISPSQFDQNVKKLLAHIQRKRTDKQTDSEQQSRTT